MGLGRYSSEVKQGGGDSDITGNLRDGSREILAESRPELAEKINAPDVDMGSGKGRNQSEVFIK